MQAIYLIRHAQATGQAPDAALSPQGEAQAAILADLLHAFPVDAVVSSPYLRAMQTIRPLAQRAGLSVTTDDRLRERVLSTLDLPNWRDLLKHSFEEPDWSAEGGESGRMAMNRGVSVLRDILRTEAQRHIAVVTHGNLMTLMLQAFDSRFGYDRWEQLTNPDVYRLLFDQGQFQRLDRLELTQSL
ncbi:histidine phosphatase family protein [Paenibacillus elgii]|uniref:histidine phosphatase family protein n=1 Tax=Paenibacillus elgii TaxID=189691 RepID=UPI00203CFD62|nr:histidine phosphatase family protein [Paenibacillus elgii]MCM3268785.1 histidine phosphatase family protein [Paenibacillus elgii]